MILITSFRYIKRTVIFSSSIFTKKYRVSCLLCDRSLAITQTGPEKTNCITKNGTPCLEWFICFFTGSHLKLRLFTEMSRKHMPAVPYTDGLLRCNISALQYHMQLALFLHFQIDLLFISSHWHLFAFLSIVSAAAPMSIVLPSHLHTFFRFMRYFLDRKTW